ncbi:hypothetical protein OEZ86_003909 [Tetradesmus obliquus]|nr:hypothetical protein OEZ86_003909 [Tetradesmus obliquus]
MDRQLQQAFIAQYSTDDTPVKMRDVLSLVNSILCANSLALALSEGVPAVLQQHLDAMQQQVTQQLAPAGQQGGAAAAQLQGQTRKALAATPPSTAGAAAAAAPKPPTQGTIQTSKGPVKVGTVAAGNARPKEGQSAAKGSTGSAKVEWGQAERCYSIGLRDYCGAYEQASCCAYLGSDDTFKGCRVASNLYTCTSQFADKPLTVCCV